MLRAKAVEDYEVAGRSGQIAECFEASFVTLDRDTSTVEADELDRTRVEQTWIEGEKVYGRRETQD